LYAHHPDHRAKNLFLGDAHLGLDVFENGGLDEVAAISSSRAAMI
jgi:hypothetical protein